MDEKEKAPQGRGEKFQEEKKNDIKSAINALTDIREALLSDLPVDSFITSWQAHNTEVYKLYGTMRKIYAEQIEFAIEFLKNHS